MQIIKEFRNHEFVYDNIKNDLKIKRISFNAETIEINYDDIIDTQFTGGNVGEKFNQLKDKLNLGIYSKAPCGGFVNFYKIISDKGNDYILYSGVKEVSNSHYIVTIHKILG